jgi:hypothetical protein
MKTATKNGDQFARLPFALIDTMIAPSSCGATKLYVLFLRRFNGYNNGAISLSVREAAGWCKCSAGTAQKILKELQEHGLIEPVVVGSFKIKAGELKNIATTWRLGDRAETRPSFKTTSPSNALASRSRCCNTVWEKLPRRSTATSRQSGMNAIYWTR